MPHGEASIWEPRSLLEISANTKSVEERQTAIANQTLFTLVSFAYVVGTGALEVYRNGIHLTKGTDWVEQTGTTFTITVPSVAGDQIVAVAHVGITGDVDPRDTDIFVSNYQAVRDYAGTEVSLYSQGRILTGDGGQRFFQKITGKPPSFFVDDNRDILVPSGGDGSVGWKSVIAVVTPSEFGAIAGGIIDATDALIAAHATGLSVWYGSYTYLVMRPNEILLFEGVSYTGNRAKIIVPATATAPDAGDGFGRFDNSVFYRNATTPLLRDIEITGIDFDIQRTKWNAIGAAGVADRDSATAAFIVRNNSIKNVGTTAGQGGTVTTGFDAGALISLSGYSLMAHNNVIKDCGNGIVAFNGLFCNIHDNELEFCGVSRDFTSWSNVAAILVRGTKSIRVTDNKSFATGGTAVFVSVGGADQVKDVFVKGNQLYACGLSAIGAGHRSSATGAQVTDQITVIGNDIRGFTCAIEATLHGGVVISSENTLSKITSVYTDNIVNYLAPYETFNYVTNEVDGSHNGNKKKGFDVGNQYSLLVQADTVDGVTLVVTKDTLLNHQRAGLLISKVQEHRGNVVIDNCGWSRDSGDSAFQLQQSVILVDIKKAVLTMESTDQSRGVSLSSSFCTPLITTDIVDLDLSLSAHSPNNQSRAYRMLNNTAGFKLNVRKMSFLNALVDAGYVNVVDDSAGTNTKDTIVTWKSPENVAINIGSRILPIGHKAVSVKFSTASPITTTLLAAAYYKDSTISFKASAGTHTIAPDGTDTIDGVNASIVLAVGQTTTLYSDGTEWFTVIGVH